MSMLARGQEYVPLLKENHLWSVSDEKYTITGDTIINEKHYQKVFFHKSLPDFDPNSLLYLAAIREDTVEKKVWLLWSGYDEEFLLYDFSLNVGNEFIVKSPFYSYNGPEYLHNPVTERKMVVSKKSTQEINGFTRRVLKVNSPDFPDFYENWIEGIGSNHGLIYAGVMAEVVMDAPYPYLLCFHENDVLVYQDDDPWGIYSDTCYAEPVTNINEFGSHTSKVTAFPTIFTDNITIRIEEPIQFIMFYDGLGRLINRTEITNDQQEKIILTSDWPKGLYILRTSGSRNNSMKLIKH